MTGPRKPPALEEARLKIAWIVRKRGLSREEAAVSARHLAPDEAIGRPARKDYPILKGRESVIEARVLGARGQAFTDAPVDFYGTIAEVLEMPLDNNHSRAIFIAVLNGLSRALGLTDRTIHCKNDEPELCAERVAAYFTDELGASRIGLVGLNPAIAEKLAERTGESGLRITDLDPQNIGSRRFGVTVEDGETAAPDMIRWADALLVTGTTLVNGTFEPLNAYAQKHKKSLLLFGMTAAGACSLLGLPRLCFYGRDA